MSSKVGLSAYYQIITNTSLLHCGFTDISHSTLRFVSIRALTPARVPSKHRQSHVLELTGKLLQHKKKFSDEMTMLLEKNVRIGLALPPPSSLSPPS